MYFLLSISLVFGYFLILGVSGYTIIYIFKNYEKYGTKLLAFLSILSICLTCIHSTLFLSSMLFYISDDINIILWKLALIVGFITLGCALLIYAFLKEYKTIPLFPSLFYTILLGLLIGSLLSPSSIQIYNLLSDESQIFLLDSSKLNYIFNLFTGTIVIVFHISIFLFFLYISLIVHKNARKKESSKILVLNSFIFGAPIIFYNLYIIFQYAIFREFYILLLWVNLIGVSFMLIKNPEMFILITNRIYYLNIYHKSGVLLYSYKFQKDIKNESDSAIWGNILIGINHILSEFIDKDDQIDILQTDNYDIIVNYDNEYGFAVLIITNRKNPMLEKLKKNFMKDFISTYSGELEEIMDYNKIINVSEFADTEDIVRKHFQPYF